VRRHHRREDAESAQVPGEQRRLRGEELVQAGCLAALAVREIVETIQARLGGGRLSLGRLRKQARARDRLDERSAIHAV
jgi:hypothetical protein